jgi:hypothetical protein
MKQKLMICWNFKNLPPKNRNKFRRLLFGSKELSHNGKYNTTVNGILTNKNYEKPIRSAIIIDETDKNEVIEILKMFNAKIRTFKILEET